MAEAAAKEGARAFVHVRAIAAEREEGTEIEYAAAKKLGEERVLFSADYPYADSAVAGRFLAAAALAAGCTVVAHPSIETPYSALALAELAAKMWDTQDALGREELIKGGTNFKAADGELLEAIKAKLDVEEEKWIAAGDDTVDRKAALDYYKKQIEAAN